MLDYLIGWDKELLLAINGARNSFLDQIMYWLSHKWIWIGLYAVLLALIYRALGFKGTMVVVLLVTCLIFLSDQLSVHLFKEQFMRLRPCHDPTIANIVIRYNGKCGGQFGFVSSHAANTSALSIFLVLVMRKYWGKPTLLLLLWSAAIGYSRVYLGVHFPADVLGGWALGATLGATMALAFSKLEQMYLNDT